MHYKTIGLDQNLPARQVGPIRSLSVSRNMTSSVINLKFRDEGRLAELGYTQELQREWSWLHNFGASFSIIVSESLHTARCTRLTINVLMIERSNWHHNPFPLRAEYWRAGCHDCRMDRCQLFYNVCCSEYGGDPVVYTNIGGPLLLGVYAFATTACSLLLLDHRLVSNTFLSL